MGVRYGRRVQMRRVIALVAVFAALALSTQAQQLLLRDFGGLKNLGPDRGEGALIGALRLADAGDRLAATSYADASAQIVADATVEKYAETQWLSHELDGAWREESGDRFAAGVSLVDSGDRRRYQYDLSTADNTTRLVAWLTKGGEVVSLRFSLVGSNRVADIPADVVDAYIALYPSTIPESVADTPEHHREWIHVEMDRVLKYGRRYLGYSETSPGPTPPDMFRDIALHLVLRFAGFRERFFGTGSRSELEAAFQEQRTAGVKANGVTVNVHKEVQWLDARLTEFENWWRDHRTDPVQLPTPPSIPDTSSTP